LVSSSVSRRARLCSNHECLHATCLLLQQSAVSSFQSLKRSASRVTYRNTLDELTARVAKTEAAFGQLSKRLWSDHGVRLETKIQVYRAAILSSLLYGSETWTPYRRRIKKLDNFHMKCLHRILNVQWQDRIPNTEILNRCQITGVEVMIMQSQLRLCGHVHRMPDSRIPKRYCMDNWQIWKI